MKTKLNLLVILSLIFIWSACKKDSVKPAATTGNNQQTSVNQSLIGKWFVVKDSVQTFDLYNLIPNIVQTPSFSNNDFVMFNKDSTATISSRAAFSAFYTDYEAFNTNSKLIINPVINPNLNLKYNITTQGYTIPLSSPQLAYFLALTNITPLNSLVDYQISLPTPTSMVLQREHEIPTVLHDYRIKEYIYLQK